MLRLASILYSIVATTLSGSFIIASLTMGYETLTPILVAVGLGAIIAFPASYFVTKAIMANS
jgi:hypothetical protein